MRKRTLIIAGFLALAAGNAFLFGALSDARDRVRALLDDKRVLTHRLSDVSQQEHEQQERLQRLRRTIETEDAPQPSAQTQEGEAQGTLNVVDGLSREHRKMLALRAHGEQLRELNLTPEQRDALLDAIVSQGYRADQSAADLRRDDEPDVEEQRAALEAQRRTYNDDVVRAIGAEKAAQFDALERRRPALAEVKMVRESLDAAGLPIDEGQRSRLLSILTRPDFQTNPDGLRLDAEGAGAAAQKWRQERMKRFQQEASSVLTAQQLTQLEAFQAADEAVAEIAAKAGGSAAYASGQMGSGD